MRGFLSCFTAWIHRFFMVFLRDRTQPAFREGGIKEIGELAQEESAPKGSKRYNPRKRLKTYEEHIERLRR